MTAPARLAGVRERAGRPVRREALEDALSESLPQVLGSSIEMVRPLKLGASSLNYLVAMANTQYVARLDVLRTAAEVAQDAVCMNTAKRVGVVTPPPPIFEGEILDVPLSVRPYVPGNTLAEVACPDFSLVADAGVQLARLHSATSPSGRPWFYQAPPRMSASVSSELRPIIRLAKEWLVRPVMSARLALIHTDFRADNLVAADDGVTVLDWEKAAVGPTWFDYGLALFHLIGGPDETFARGAADTFTQTYAQEARARGREDEMPHNAVAVAAATYMLVDVEIYSATLRRTRKSTVDSSHAAYFEKYCLPTFERFAQRYAPE